LERHVEQQQRKFAREAKGQVGGLTLEVYVDTSDDNWSEVRLGIPMFTAEVELQVGNAFIDIAKFSGVDEAEVRDVGDLLFDRALKRTVPAMFNLKEG